MFKSKVIDHKMFISHCPPLMNLELLKVKSKLVMFVCQLAGPD